MPGFSFAEAIILADAEAIGRAALEAGFPIQLAQISAQNCITYPITVAQIRDFLGYDDLRVAMAMMDPEAFIEGLIARGGSGKSG